MNPRMAPFAPVRPPECQAEMIAVRIIGVHVQDEVVRLRNCFSCVGCEGCCRRRKVRVARSTGWLGAGTAGHGALAGVVGRTRLSRTHRRDDNERVLHGKDNGGIRHGHPTEGR